MRPRMAASLLFCRCKFVHGLVSPSLKQRSGFGETAMRRFFVLAVAIGT